MGPSNESVILGNAIDVGTFARAGFQSSAKITTYAILDIVVPPGMQEVEVHPIATRRGEQIVQSGCFEGVGYSALERSLWLTARNADGTFHVFENPVVDGFCFAEDFLNSSHPFTPCTPLSIPFPLPAVPLLTTSDELPPLHIHAPPPPARATCWSSKPRERGHLPRRPGIGRPTARDQQGHGPLQEPVGHIAASSQAVVAAQDRAVAARSAHSDFVTEAATTS